MIYERVALWALGCYISFIPVIVLYVVSVDIVIFTRSQNYSGVIIGKGGFEPVPWLVVCFLGYSTGYMTLFSVRIFLNSSRNIL